MLKTIIAVTVLFSEKNTATAMYYDIGYIKHYLETAVEPVDY